MKKTLRRMQKFFNGKNIILSIVFCSLTLCGVIVTAVQLTGCMKNAVNSDGLVTGAPKGGDTENASAQVVQAPAPVVGEKAGRLAISGTSVDCPVFYGDEETELQQGAGIYMGGKVFGQGGTVLVAGHTGTFFRDFESAEMGDEIVMVTDYGEYHYEIVEMCVIEDADAVACRLDATEENIVLYTCYPFGQLEITNQRYFIYGKYISGPQVAFEEVDNAP